ncbi:hypothetical protein KAI31_05800, partial [Candidatus Bathyarchaeota archaeon]|nr:hypothetical protein [Candidatus Bathyarchaeota archaeon]
MKEAMVEILKAFFSDIVNETNGFGFGEPWRPGPEYVVAILPITRQIRRQRDYITLNEAGDEVSIEDTEHIDEVIVTNKSGKSIFIAAACLLIGGTQARIVTKGVVISARETRPISVACVQQSHPIIARAILRPDKVAPREVEEIIYRHRGTQVGALQDELWRESREYGEKVLPIDKADNLIDAHRSHVRAIEKVLSQLPEVPNQVGFTIIVPKGVGSLECFDSPDSWEAMGKSLIEKEVKALERKRDEFDSVFEYKPQQARSLLRRFLQREFVVETIISGDNWETVGVSA